MKTIIAFACLALLSTSALADAPSKTPPTKTTTLVFDDKKLAELHDVIVRAGHGCGAASDDGQIDCQIGMEAKDLYDDLKAQVAAQQKAAK